MISKNWGDIVFIYTAEDNNWRKKKKDLLKNQYIINGIRTVGFGKMYK